MLIWYGNIPEEVTHYISRTNGPWLYLFAINFIVNWIIPFLALLSVRAKCTTELLKVITVLLLCGHWLDLYLLVTPSVWKTPRIGFVEIAIAAGYAALIFLVVVRGLGKAALVPVNDPVLGFERLHSFAHHEPVHGKLRGVEQ
jgi:hypothetical protein